MPQAETGADIPAGRQSEKPEEPEHGARVHGERAERASGAVKTESDEPRQQRVPVAA